jgi:N-hydroxyarylamine O-acetyltransferase
MKAAGIDLDAYFARIGFRGAARADLDTLRALHRLHPAAIAFENLDPLLGRPVSLEPARIAQKLLADGRGGYCYEHNCLFRDVLLALGFQVSGLIARVLWNQPEDAITSRTHMLLRVALDGADWIADVGFGGLTLTGPLRLDGEGEQATPHEPFRLLPDNGSWRAQARLAGAWKTLYRFDLTEQFQIDYELCNYYQSTHPAARFTTTLMAARALPDRRCALVDNRLSIHRADGASAQRRLSAAELRRTLADDFGLRLPDDPALDGVLARFAAVP